MSFRDISDHIHQMYDVEISHATLSEITERVIPQVKEWQNRPLESLYTIVWLDAMHYKVRDGGRVVTRAVYNVLGVNRHGYKDLIGMYVSESEGANFCGAARAAICAYRFEIQRGERYFNRMYR